MPIPPEFREEIDFLLAPWPDEALDVERTRGIFLDINPSGTTTGKRNVLTRNSQQTYFLEKYGERRGRWLYMKFQERYT